MNLREITAKKLIEEVELPAAEEAWSNMYRNAHLFAQASDGYPDLEGEREHQMFWDWLGDRVCMEVDWLQETIYEDYDLDLKLYQYGRSGATIAPDSGKFAGMGIGNHFNRELDPEAIICWDDYEYLDEECNEPEWSDAYTEVVNYRKAFEFINETVRAGVREIPTLWAEFKQENPDLFDQEEEEETEAVAA